MPISGGDENCCCVGADPSRGGNEVVAMRRTLAVVRRTASVDGDHVAEEDQPMGRVFLGGVLITWKLA
jgi:hypothetical protein